MFCQKLFVILHHYCDVQANHFIMNVKSIRIEDFDYPLPDERIARHPLPERESCKLLVADNSGNISHYHFYQLPEFLSPNTVMFCNDTRVINARLEFFKATGSRIEIFLLEPGDPSDYVMMFQARRYCQWTCLVGNRKRWKQSPLEKVLKIKGKDITLRATLGEERPGNAFSVTFDWDDESVIWAEIVDVAGAIPIPPYLNRDSEDSDNVDYQTVYAHYRGSVAAPTAGLHFTESLLDRLREKGIRICPVTLHVGAGTFQPVKSEAIGDHPMHTETFSVSASMLRTLLECVENKLPVLAVGTTTVRTLESLPYLGWHLMQGDSEMHVYQWEAYDTNDFDTADAIRAILRYMEGNGVTSLTAATSIMIAPGFNWRLVNNMVTNFHQPQSTLLLLVSSFLGGNLWKLYYNEAVNNDYRFLSYGDACLFRK